MERLEAVQQYISSIVEECLGVNKLHFVNTSQINADSRSLAVLRMKLSSFVCENVNSFKSTAALELMLSQCEEELSQCKAKIQEIQQTKRTHEEIMNMAKEMGSLIGEGIQKIKHDLPSFLTDLEKV